MTREILSAKTHSRKTPKSWSLIDSVRWRWRWTPDDWREMCVTVCLGGHNADCNGTEVCRLVPDADLEGLSRQKPQDQDRHPNRQAAEHETCRVSVDISLFFVRGKCSAHDLFTWDQ